MNLISCRCGAQWTEENRAHCSKCHQLFRDVEAFERHFRRGRCDEPWKSGLLWTGSYWSIPLTPRTVHTGIRGGRK